MVALMVETPRFIPTKVGRGGAFSRSLLNRPDRRCGPLDPKVAVEAWQRLASAAAMRLRHGNQMIRAGQRMKSFEFASLLCSRLCHDLLSPVGALNNGIELLADEHDPDMRARCLELLADSARASANRLKFFRLAFGAAGGFGDEVDTEEARAAIEGLFGSEGKVTLAWMVEESRISKSALKVLLNLVLLAGDALVRGGTLTVGAEKHDRGLDIVVRAEGARIVIDPELKRALLGESSEEDIAPRAAAAWLAHCLVTDGGGNIQLADEEEGMLLLGAALPA